MGPLHMREEWYGCPIPHIIGNPQDWRGGPAMLPITLFCLFRVREFADEDVGCG
jgi:hypothetical protein